MINYLKQSLPAVVFPEGFAVSNHIHHLKREQSVSRLELDWFLTLPGLLTIPVNSSSCNLFMWTNSSGLMHLIKCLLIISWSIDHWCSWGSIQPSLDDLLCIDRTAVSMFAMQAQCFYQRDRIMSVGRTSPINVLGNDVGRLVVHILRVGNALSINTTDLVPESTLRHHKDIAKYFPYYTYYIKYKNTKIYRFCCLKKGALRKYLANWFPQTSISESRRTHTSSRKGAKLSSRNNEKSLENVKTSLVLIWFLFISRIYPAFQKYLIPQTLVVLGRSTLVFIISLGRTTSAIKLFHRKNRKIRKNLQLNFFIQQTNWNKIPKKV